MALPFRCLGPFFGASTHLYDLRLVFAPLLGGRCPWASRGLHMTDVALCTEQNVCEASSCWLDMNTLGGWLEEAHLSGLWEDGLDMYRPFYFFFALSVLLHLTTRNSFDSRGSYELIRFIGFACFCCGIEGICSLSSQVASVSFVLFGLLPRSVVALLFSCEAKRKSGWGICGSSSVCCSFIVIIAAEFLLYSLNSTRVQSSVLGCLYQFQDRASELYRPHPEKKQVAVTWERCRTKILKGLWGHWLVPSSRGHWVAFIK